MPYHGYVSSDGGYIGQPHPMFYLIADLKHSGTTTTNKRDVPGTRVTTK